MKVLYLSNKPIYPKIDGGCVAMAATLDLMLSLNFEIDHIAIATDKHPFIQEAYPIHSGFSTESIHIDTRLNIFQAFKHLFNSQSYNLSRFFDTTLEDMLDKRIQSNNYDIILCESLFVLPYIKTIKKAKAKLIVRTHNVEFKIWERLAEQHNGIKKWYLRKLAKDLKQSEINLLNQADLLLAITDLDKSYFKENEIRSKIEVLPFNVTIPSFQVDYHSQHFAHLGAMNWRPNIEAVDLLIKHIFPLIKQQNNHAELHLAGSFFPESIIENRQHGIHVHGFVDDKNDFLNKYSIQLIPLQSGSGVRIKLLESMALGCPIITTSIGAEGIDYKKYNSLIIADTPEEFSVHAVELMKNADLRRELGQNARKHIIEVYDREKIKAKFIEFIRS